MIYFIQPVDGGPIKIGFSEDVGARRRQLEAYYGRPLALLATVEGGCAEEQAVHERFSHLRLGLSEQFRPAFDLIAFIQRPLLVDANPDAVEAMFSARTATKKVRVSASPEWIAWLERAAAHSRTDVAKFVDWACLEHAKASGFDEPPPKRVP